MTDFVDRYEQQLVDAARARVARPAWRRRWRLPSRTALVVIGTVAVGGTALAATQPWTPLLGTPKNPGATATLLPPPAGQLATLGVLRRPQTDADRGPQTTYALSFMSRRNRGVRTDAIRLLATEPDGRGFVLIPVAHRDDPRGDPAGDRQLCVFSVAEDGKGTLDGGGLSCFSLADVQAGRAVASLGLRRFGLVPDGVDQVVARFAERTVRTPVTGNFFVFTAPLRQPHPGPIEPDDTPDLPVSTEWLDASGATIKTVTGRGTMSRSPTG